MLFINSPLCLLPFPYCPEFEIFCLTVSSDSDTTLLELSVTMAPSGCEIGEGEEKPKDQMS